MVALATVRVQNAHGEILGVYGFMDYKR